MPDREGKLGPHEVASFLRELSTQPDTIMVGGQAISLWLWIYAERYPLLDNGTLLASKDIDYIGTRDVARAFSQAVGGEIFEPTIDDATPNTALVNVTIGGRIVQVDFLHEILGVKRREVRFSKIEILFDDETLIIPVLHPVQCLISRVLNILHPAVRRSDDFAIQQFAASYEIVTLYLHDLLMEKEFSEFNYCVKELHRFLRSHEHGRVCHMYLEKDLLNILRVFRSDRRIDVRYRDFNLSSMIRAIEQRRSRDEPSRPR